MTNYTTNDLEQRGLAEMAYERDLAAQTARAESAEARADALAAEVERLKRECADLWRVIGVGSVKQNEPPTLEDWRWVRSILDGASKVDLAGQWYWRPLPAPPQE